MAQYQSHISFSTFFGIAYGLAGFYFFGFSLELVLLAAIIAIVTGMLPNVDAGSEAPAHQLAGLVAAMVPILIFKHYPSVTAGGISRMTLVFVISYLATRVVVVRFLQAVAVHRGMFHSLPALIIAFEVVFLMFWDLFWDERLFLALAGFMGYYIHLLMDAYGNVDLVGSAMGKSEKKLPVFKVASDKLMATLVAWALVVILGYFVFKEFFPNFRIFAGVTY